MGSSRGGQALGWCCGAMGSVHPRNGNALGPLTAMGETEALEGVGSPAGRAGSRMQAAGPAQGAEGMKVCCGRSRKW